MSDKHPVHDMGDDDTAAADVPPTTDPAGPETTATATD